MTTGAPPPRMGFAPFRDEHHDAHMLGFMTCHSVRP